MDNFYEKPLPIYFVNPTTYKISDKLITRLSSISPKATLEDFI